MIADDVGVGKTIEAGLIAKELLERGEIRRLAVLCPPALCDQWRAELHRKFLLDAVVVRGSTLRQLEAALAPGATVFQAYPYLVASIDFVKQDRYREAFLAACPEFVILDEAHGAASPGNRGGERSAQHWRHALARRIAADPAPHLVLLTATPHSGVPEAFASLVALLDPTLVTAGEQEGAPAVDSRRLAAHFVQRRRADVAAWLGNTTPFPTRETAEVAYHLGGAYGQLFQDVWAFTRELVREPGLSRPRQRVRYWAALALLRSVMSSPAAMEALGASAAAAGPPLGPGWGPDTAAALTRFEVWGTTFATPGDFYQFCGYAGPADPGGADARLLRGRRLLSVIRVEGY